MKFLRFSLAALITFLSLNALAQNVAPTISDPQELAILEQKKDETFKKLFKDPTNLSLLFEYANYLFWWAI